MVDTPFLTPSEGLPRRYEPAAATKEREEQRLGQDPNPLAPPNPARRVGRFLWEVAKVIVIALLIIVPVRLFLVQPFVVRGASMEDSFFDRDYLVVDQLSYRFREPARGEVVVFRFPQDPSQFFIKRIVGLPGEKVLVRDGKVIVRSDQFPDGLVLTEKYLSAGTVTSGNLTIQLNAAEYFVLGDNRSASSDSRQWGALPFTNIVGRAWVRIWPFDSVTRFTPPEYTLLSPASLIFSP